jgi:hypothetical protein
MQRQDARRAPPVTTRYCVRWMSGAGIDHMPPYISMLVTFFGH